MPTKKPKISIYLEESQKAELEAWAAEETRSLSNLATHLIEKALEQRAMKRKNPLNQKQGG
ncbi:MAG: hypothetical protein F6K28_02030 [Microcoleus sp. SIO2G3]|nr:hypothetical protein [Microcoleus sp. SIO2G3]